MVLCHCRGVNDRVIDAAISCGARCPDDVAAACGAGGDCGGCVPAIEELLAERLGGSLVAAGRTT